MTAKQLPPPATNRGVEKQVSLLIHWIECTFKKGIPVHYDERLQTTKTECKPYDVYNIGVRYPDGRVELSHSSRAEMGVHVVTSGAVLDMFPIEPIQYLKSLISHRATITRLDLAIDAINCNLRPQKATERIKANACRTRSRKFPRSDDAIEPGYTQYIGKKSSECCVRIYDKAAETNTTGDYTRVEIVFKASRAHAAAQAVARGADYRSMLRGFVDFDGWKEWSDLFTIPPVRIHSQEVETNTRKWLLQVAAASLAREIHLAGDDDFYFRFQDAVKVKLEELRDRYDSVNDKVG